MSVYTHLNENQIDSLVKEFGLPSPARFEGITSGTVNSNFLLFYPERKLILTLFEQLDEHSVNKYLDLQNFLAQQKYPSPFAIKTKTDQWVTAFQNKPVALISFIEGNSSSNPTPEQCEQAGIYLAKLHTLTQNYAVQIKNPLGNSWRKQAIELIWEEVTPDDHLLIQQLDDKLNAIPWADLPKAVIHNDYFRDNVHFRGNELTGVIDFYYAATDACLFDLCIAINDWCTRWEQDSVELSTLKYEHFLQGYKSIRPLETIETNNIHTMLQIGAWHFWIYRLYVNLHKKPGSSITMKNPNEFKWMLLERLKEF